MSLLSLSEVSFTWDSLPLLDAVTLEIERGERIGLVGRNGAGKSTLMKLLIGDLAADTGTLRRDKNVRIARLVQEVPEGMSGSIADVVARGWFESGESVFDSGDDWKLQNAVETILTRMGLDGDQPFASLSSGMKRRTLLAQSLVHEPDILLLDEPTNHLDIESIDWLETFLRGYAGTLVFITHDREFLQKLATRILELDRGRLFDWTCDYATFLQRKQAALESEEKQNALFDKKLAVEEVWIRKGVKARRTRSEGRVRELKKMRLERSRRREKIGNVKMQASEAERSGHLVIEADELGFSYGDKQVISSFSTLISRGDKIGIIGPNGAGKTTLLKLLLGQLEPTEGTVRRGTNLQMLYFDQLREQIDEEKTVVENVGEGQETLLIDGNRRHIYGYLQDFLFTPERARRPARYLSGGERNRMLLARLFKRPSNLLILDEPTNDLDLETLELLEEILTSYAGTLLLVSHDRAFLNNIVTGIIAVEGNGFVRELDGGYDDYVRVRAQESSQPETRTPTSPKMIATAVVEKKTRRRSNKEERELESLPLKIETLETQQSELQELMSQPEFFKQTAEKIAETTARLEAVHTELEGCYRRWEELDALS